MQIYLSGGGDASQSFLLDQLFAKEIGTNGQMLYIPLAIVPERFSFEECFHWITSTYSQHHFNNIEMIHSLDELETMPKPKAIYIGGGNTYKLLNLLKANHKDIYLKNFLASEGIVFGGSAGAIIFGKTILTASIGQDSDINEVGLDDLAGLNLLDDFTVHCHYLPTDKTELMNLFAKTKSPILCLPEDSGIVYENHVITVIGFQSVDIITDKVVKLDINQTLDLCNY